MRIAFISDIHANREALDACVAHAKRQGVDRWVFLGDLVGYGADPVYVVDKVRELAGEECFVVKGNHDAAAASGVAENMNDYATAAITWTYDELDEDARNYLRTLPMAIEDEDRLYVHAEANRPDDWRYVTDGSSAERSLRATDKRLTFCGHIHVPQLYHMAPQKPAIGFKPQNGAPVPLVASRKWLMVQGAVGQPRDRNPAAAYGLFDSKRNEMSYLRVPYDIESAARKIHAAGLPQLLAARLFIGR